MRDNGHVLTIIQAILYGQMFIFLVVLDPMVVVIGATMLAWWSL
jgi:hypothetical protein